MPALTPQQKAEVHELFLATRKQSAKVKEASSLTLPTDSQSRKQIPLLSGCVRYFPAALAGVAKHSLESNEKHNPGEPLHWSREKSADHGEAILRHMVDLQDILAAQSRGQAIPDAVLLTEVNALTWRALALSQELHERAGAPTAPGAR